MALLVAFCATALHAAEQPAEETPPLTEKIRDVSPDGKYAMRIAYDADLNARMIVANDQRDAERINSETIYRIELVRVRDGAALLDLMKGEDNLGGGANFEGITMLWSADSSWFAYYWTYPRVGYTTVYQLRGEKFRRMNRPAQLSVRTKGDVRNEYIKPLRWVKPGSLELEQIRIYHGEAWDDTLRFVARFDGPGKFKVVSKKTVEAADE